jgi:hypothetical protein
MKDVVDSWEVSGHANSNHGYNANTYCAKCHSPFQADADAKHDDNDPISDEDWAGVTCSACHPPHDLRVKWGTDLGTYDIKSGEWSPVYKKDHADVCLQCHNGDDPEGRHYIGEFQGFGKSMLKQIGCEGCHMPKVDAGNGEFQSHAFVKPDGANSCGTGFGADPDCHPNKDLDWAQKQWDKNKIHNGMPEEP